MCIAWTFSTAKNPTTLQKLSFSSLFSQQSCNIHRFNEIQLHQIKFNLILFELTKNKAIECIQITRIKLNEMNKIELK